MEKSLVMGQKGRNRKSRSNFRSRCRYVRVKVGSPLARRDRSVHPPFSGVDANELYKKEMVEKDKKKSA